MKRSRPAAWSASSPETKSLIRKAEPRTVEDAWRKLRDLLDLFSPAECANFLRNSGCANTENSML